MGNAWISGFTTDDFGTHSAYADRTKTPVDEALLVGGIWNASESEATLRVATTNNGRVGINVTRAELDRALVVDGESRFTGDARFQQDIEVHGGGGSNTAEIRTDITSGQFNFLMNSGFTGSVQQSVGGVNGLKVAGWVQNVEVANETTADQFMSFGTKSLHSNIFIGTTPDTPATNISKVEIGGAYNNNESLSYTEVKTKSFKVNGDFQLGTRRGITETVRLSTTAGTVNFFSDSGSASTINFGLNASEVNIAGQGGKTTINNQLEVIASAEFNGDVKICGGLASFAFEGLRGQSGSTIVEHQSGVLGQSQFNKNIDILNVNRLAVTDDGYNQIDTAGSGNWGGSAYQQEVTNIGGTPVVEPQFLPALSGDEFYLPLKNLPEVNGVPYYQENNYLLIDSAVVGSTGYPEFVQIVELTRINAAPYYIKVKRKPFGTFTGQLENHPDTTAIYKVNVQFDSTWTEQYLDNTGPKDNVYLAEFGGALNEGDYVIVDREDTDSDGIFDQGEVIKVETSLDQLVQKFTITDCGDPTETTVFEVDTVTGDTYIGGDVTLEGGFNLKGGCGTTQKGTFTGTITPVTGTTATFIITNISAADIAKVSIGDVISFNVGGIAAEMQGNTRITEIGTDFVKLTKPLILTATINNVVFKAVRNEEFILTNGSDQNTLYFDTCSASLEVGNQFRRIDISRLTPSSQDPDDTVAAYSGSEDDYNIFSYWVDPATINAGGPTTTLTAQAATGAVAGSVYLTVADLGTGSGRFTIDDLIIVGKTSQVADKGVPSGSDDVQWEIMKIAAVDVPGKVIRALPAQEGTTAQALTDYPATTTTVVRILKHPESSQMIDIQERSRDVAGVATPYVSMIINRGHIVQTKLDYTQWIRITDGTNDNLLSSQWWTAW